MEYIIETNQPQQIANITAALEIMDSEAKVVVPPTAGILLRIEIDEVKQQVKINAPQLLATDESKLYSDTEIFDERYTAGDRHRRLKELVRYAVIKTLEPQLQKSPPWGVLSAVRPTKLFHYLRDKGFSVDELRPRLIEIYGLDPVKAELLIEVGSLQEKYFKPHNYISVYLGIPFCPTRCGYCSFPAVSLETHRHQVPGYLQALQREITVIGELCRELDLKVETIYMGGGTPTSLEDADFRAVLGNLAANFYQASVTSEFTVEAGRPETLNEAKIQAMNDVGVTRVSVNPQTMHDGTLQRIGRYHSVADIYRAVEMVREKSSLALNMDLIQGLPGESTKDFWESLQQVVALSPENLTVHTLAPKRAAAWNQIFDQLDHASDEELAELSGPLNELLAASGYHPYYLYRQRRILADLENVGYAKNGFDNIYNIQMMEERQTILGIGAGAMTKWLTGDENELLRYPNTKCPVTYSNRLEEILEQKKELTKKFFNVKSS